MIGKEIKYLDYWCRETWEMILHEAKDPQNNCLHGYLSSSLSARVDHLRQLQIALMASQDRVETLRLVEEMRGEVDELLEEIARDMGNKLSRFLKDRGLEPFQAHLMRLRMLLSDTITRDLSEAKILLAKIRGDVASFEDAFHEINQSQKAVEGLFGTVEQLVDDLLDGPDGAAAPAAPCSGEDDSLKRLVSKLSSVDRQVAVIAGRIGESFRLSPAEVTTTTAGRPGAHQVAAAMSKPTGLPPQQQLAVEWCGVQHHLRLAINSLDTRLKRCLLCLAVFPENTVVKTRLLIHWWIGEGMVKSVPEGKEEFDQLAVDRGFIAPLARPSCDRFHSCMVPPWVRRLLVSSARSSAFLDLDARGNPKNSLARMRRACLSAGKPSHGFRADVHTIYNVDQRYIVLDQTWFKGLEALSTLQLGTWRDHDYDPVAHHIELTNEALLRDVGACRNLRYLSLRGISRIDVLPDSVGKLCNLVILDLRSCHNLVVLRKEIKSLVSLQYLDVSGCYLLAEMPKGIGKLTRLQVIKGFVVANSNSKDPCRLNEMRNLTNLRKLSVVIGATARPEEGELRVFADLGALLTLTVTWGGLTLEKAATRSTAAAAACTAFALPPGLNKLELRCYPVPEFPSWADPDVLTSLKMLYIRGGMLRALGENSGWKVQILRARFLKQHIQ